MIKPPTWCSSFVFISHQVCWEVWPVQEDQWREQSSSGEALESFTCVIGIKIFKMGRPNILQLLHFAVLWFYLLLPSVLCDNLFCYYSPILEKEKTFELIVTECPPNELCFKAEGRYGNHSALSARGCMAKSACSQEHSIRLKGTVYTMSYSCCESPYCNSCPGATAKSLYVTVTLMTVALMTGSW
ncbi:protein Bouncer [Cyclopterus lumpus]|uniref:protein Bouncer n=1 Tax=Cyclopterus lumpus TaxID=8103 RepID=UPI0014875B09|nr:protein Bouncer [Cyclopterus lumpus]